MAGSSSARPAPELPKIKPFVAVVPVVVVKKEEVIPVVVAVVVPVVVPVVVTVTGLDEE